MSARQHTSLYLLKNNALALIDQEFDGKQKHNLTGELDGFFYLFHDAPTPPAWAVTFYELTGSELTPAFETQHPGALLIIKYKGYDFLFSFGNAWNKIKINWYHSNFGKKIALNSIPNDQLSSLKMEQVLARWHIATETAPNPTKLQSFGVQAGRDLVHGIEGKPAAALLEAFGSKIKGFSALGFKMAFSNIKDTLDHTIAQYQSSNYKNIWPELDYISQLTDQALVQQLDALLELKLASPQSLAILLSVPNLKDQDANIPSAYWIGRIKRVKNSGITTSPSLYINAWLSLCTSKRQTPTVSYAKETSVHLFDDAMDEIGLTNVYNCFCDEEGLNGRQYILSGGVWYGIELNFISQTNVILNRIVTTRFPLTRWNGSDLEGAYNEQCCTPVNGLICMDAKNIHYGGGQSKFEFCDIWDPNNNVLYFVKNVSSSAHFSHLAEQIRRTLELLFSSDQSFRDQLINKINAEYPNADTAWLKQRAVPGTVKLCMVSMGRHFNQFPFFAKCSLAKLVNEIGINGHEIEFFEA